MRKGHMFAVIYHWKRKSGVTDRQFRDHWHKGTLHIYKTFGSYGSSLHKMDSKTYVAYARWPDKRSWKHMMRTESQYPNKPLVTSMRKPICVKLVDDMLKKSRYTQQ